MRIAVLTLLLTLAACAGGHAYTSVSTGVSKPAR